MASTPPVDPAELVGRMLQTITTSIESINFATEGQFLLGVLTIIALSLAGIRHMLASETYADVISSLVMIVLTWGFASYVIGSPNAPGAFLPGLNSGFDLIAEKVLEGKTFNETLGSMLHSAFELLAGSEAANMEDTRSWTEKIADFGYSLLSVGMKLFSAFLVVITALLYAGQYLVTQFMIKIGTLLAPLLVPWIMFQPTRFLFEGWLKFMIVAGMQKVVGALMLAASSGIILEAKAVASQAGDSAEANFYVYSVVLLVLGIMAYLMMQATGTAHALVAGGMGMGRFSAPSKLQPGGGMIAASGAMSRTAGASVKAAGATYTAGKAVGGGLSGGLSSPRGQRIAGAVAGAQAGASFSVRSAAMNKITGGARGGPSGGGGGDKGTPTKSGGGKS